MKKLYSILLLLCLFTATSAIAQVKIKGYSTYMKFPDRSAVSNDGKFLYISNTTQTEVFKISQQTGLLERIQQLKTGKEGAGDLRLTPDNKFIIAADYGEHKIIIFKRNATTGKLSVFKSYANSINGAVNIIEPHHLALSPDGKFITFTCAWNRDAFLVVAKFQNGQLAFVEKKMAEYGEVFFSPNGEYAVAKRTNARYECGYNVMKIMPSGNLVNIGCLEGMVRTNRFSPTPDALGNRTQESVHISINSVVFSPDGKDAYIDGTHYPTSVKSRPAIVHFRWMNGELKRQKNYLDIYKSYGLDNIADLHLDGSGDYMYVCSTGKQESGIFVIKRNPFTGSLSFVKSFIRKNNLPRLLRPFRASFHPSNKYIYVSSYYGGYVAILHNPTGKPSPQKLIEPTKDEVIEDIVIDDKHTKDDDAIDNGKEVTGSCNGIAINKNQLNQFAAKLQQQNGEKTRLEYALQHFEKYCFQSVEVARLANTFQSEYMRLEFVKFMYYYTSDTEHFYLLNSLFTNARMKQALQKHIQG